MDASEYCPVHIESSEDLVVTRYITSKSGEERGAPDMATLVQIYDAYQDYEQWRSDTKN